MIDGKQTMISAFWGSHFGISPLKRDKIVPLGLSIKSHMGPIKINPSKIEMGPASLIKNYLLDPFRSFTFGNTWDCVAVVFEKFFCFSLQICVCVRESNAPSNFRCKSYKPLTGPIFLSI